MMKSKKLLILDDDKLFCDAVREEIGSECLQVTTAHSVGSARTLCNQHRFDVVLLDNGLPDGSGLSLMPDILRFHDRAKIILITAFPSWDDAVTALKIGGYDYLSKPVEIDELRLTVERALRSSELEQLEQIQSYKSDRESEEAVLVGEGPMFAEVQGLIRKAATSNASVLITGDTGTGKNVVARAIHYSGLSRAKPFISINCAALPENLIETELFGVEKGAFTGAVATRKGTFELADDGTLFLDEIGEMPQALQSKLLSVLEDRKVKRVGGEVVRSVNVRIIAATNLETEQAMREGRFRRDLYYRLSVVHIHLKPLKERRQDIALLCKFFAQKITPAREVYIPGSEIEILMEYDWPGNVRELKNVIERCLILQEGSTIYPSQLLTTSKVSASKMSYTSSAFEDVLLLEEVERRHILKTLKQLSNNYTHTAKALGVSLSTLKRKLKEYE